MPRYPQPNDGVPVWALVMDYRGRRLAWTSDGKPIAGLEALTIGSVELGEIPDALDLDGKDVRDGVSVALPWFEDEQPKDIQGAEVELALVPLSDWSKRYVMLLGRVTLTELDRPGQLIGVEVAPLDDAGDKWPPSTWVVNDNTFVESTTNPLAIFPAFFQQRINAEVYTVTVGPDPSNIGTGYPVPYGRTDGSRPSYQLPIVDRDAIGNNSKANELLVAGGIFPDVDFGLWVEVNDILDESTLSAPTIEHSVDALGQPINTINIHTANSDERKSKRWFISINENASPTPSAGAGHVAAWMLGRSKAVDLGWSAEAIQRSTAMEIGGYIDEPVGALEWVQDRVTGRFPIATSRAPGGLLRLVWVPYLGGPVVAELTDGERGVLRAGSVEERGEAKAQRVEVRYRLDASRDKYTKSLVMADGPTVESTETETIEADDVHTQTSAGVVAKYALWRKRYRRNLSVDVPVDVYGWLLPGMVVRYTDADLGISAKRYIVVSIQRTDRPFTALELTPI